MTGAVVRQVHSADQGIVDRAVAAARLAAPGWAALPVAERAGWMRRLADGIEACFDDLVAVEIGATGKPLEQSRTLDIRRGAANFRMLAEIAAQRPVRAFPLP